MRAPRHDPGRTLWRAGITPLALAVLCGLIGALASSLHAQDAEPDPTAIDAQPPPDAAPLPPPGPLKVMSWNIASSPYAIAMRKIKSETKSWRTSFGSERRTVTAPPMPQASAFDADVVLVQGIINPRALRRLFPARKWRLVFSRRALEALPKGSVFTTPVSTTEVEAVAVRFRPGLRIINRGESMDEREPPSTEQAAVADQNATSVAAPPPPANAPPAPPDSPGVAVKVLDRGKTIWFASVSLGEACGDTADACAKLQRLLRWRATRRQNGDAVVIAGRLHCDGETRGCANQTIEADVAPPNALPLLGKGENRDVLGCVSELTLD